MNLSSFSETSSSRPTSFFIEDILLNKPKTMCRTEFSPGLFRPGIPDYGFQCIPGTHLLYPHQVLQAQNFLHKHSDHPFLIPTTGKSTSIINLLIHFWILCLIFCNTFFSFLLYFPFEKLQKNFIVFIDSFKWKFILFYRGLLFSWAEKIKCEFYTHFILCKMFLLNGYAQNYITICISNKVKIAKWKLSI